MSQLYGVRNEDLPSVSEDPNPLNEPGTCDPPRIADTFERTEDKYLVSRDLHELFLDLLQERMTPSYPIPGTQYTLIESRYYDSAELHFYQHHFQSLPMRFKLRTRRYGPNGEWQADMLHLELKSKQQKISRKERFRIGDEDLRTVTSGGLLALTPSLRELNPEIKKKRLRKRLEKINAVLHEFAPQPMCAVRYVRRAFEQDGVRVTVDNNLRTRLIGSLSPETVGCICECPHWAKMQRMGCKIQDDNCFLLEVKHDGTKPDWLEQMIQAYELKDTRFSKYCYAITGFIATGNGSVATP